MNAERLLQHYDRIADAPDAIARLRRFILDLAVRGKLVPQDPEDEPALELLKRIEKDKNARTVSARDRRAEKIVPLSPETERFTIADNWVWARFGDVTISRDGERIPVSRDEREQRGKKYDYYGASGVIDKIDGYLFDKPLLLIGEDGANLINRSTPIAFIARGRYWVNNHAHVLDGLSEELLRYLELFVNAIDLKPYVTGTAQPKMNQAKMNGIPVALPPLAEQHRIVAKVDELMALCDELDAARTEREAKRDRLAAASLARLNTPDPETIRNDACFALDALDALTARRDQIKQLRQTILNLAVRGKLVPQDPADEPAVELLDRISVERAVRARKGAIPKPKATNRDVARLSEGLPTGWFPVALGDVCDLVTSGSRGWGEYYAVSGPGFIRAQNIRFGRMRLDDLAFVQPPSNSEGSRTQVYRNDLLIVITGAGVTNPALLEEDLGEAYVSQHVGLVRPSDASLSPWLLLCLMADAGGRGELVECAYGAGKPGLNLDNIRSLSVPLPPLVEQHLIVAKVDQLMALCDQVEASLTSTDETRKKLLDALLAEALVPLNGIALQEAAE
ncbi:hypothetical protein ASC97_20595 [Rhizobium sp. Root1203]|uniref:restriction endonuclease subunit S n=1 Tax=Rhizobium sp. Root1203 TaxID=1736427 RepID=UPI00070B36DD|nr:restriction endonuclease subunit S [Rhizobium sp. Root1203]KQV30605.1 hypothetical protein ASC97_20595 [Rhizobium sp. Root1203]